MVGGRSEQLRTAAGAQWEIRQYAEAVAEIVNAIWPRTFALFEEYDLCGAHLSQTEAHLVREILRDAGGGDAVAALRKRLG